MGIMVAPTTGVAMQWDKGPAELGTAPGARACPEMETVTLTAIIIIDNRCLRAWDKKL